MSGAGIDDRTNYFSRLASFVWLSLAELAVSPSHSRRDVAARRWARRTLVLGMISTVVIVALVFAFDVIEIGLMPPRGTAGLWPVRILTDFGKSGYVLWSLAGILLAIALISPLLRGTSRGILISFGTRILFIFFAILVPVLAGEIVKGIIGRGRPFVGGQANAFNFSHFTWAESYASFPSGHAIASVALAFAVTTVWPRLRIPMAIYAIVIIITRLVLLAHHPSDVVAGALTGIIGAMFVRYWFAARHLVFTIRSDGMIEPLPGPSPTHLKRVARDAFAP
jgi:membrane-associated phospholipid phosphatase